MAARGDSACRFRQHRQPLFRRAADRPLVARGVKSGERLGRLGGDLGARRPKPAGADAGRMLCCREFKPILRIRLLPMPCRTGLGSKVLLDGLPEGTRTFYAALRRISESGIDGEAPGRAFRTAPPRRSIFVRRDWRYAGQVGAIDPSRCGCELPGPCSTTVPDFFIHWRSHLCRLSVERELKDPMGDLEPNNS